jgi:O-antigen ligase
MNVKARNVKAPIAFYALLLGAALFGPVLVVGGIGPAVLLAFCGLVAALAVAVTDPGLWRQTAPVEIGLGLLLAWAAFGMLRSPEFVNAAAKAIELAGLFLAFVALLHACALLGAPERDKLVLAFALSLGLAIAAALDFRFGHPAHDWLWRIAGVSRQWSSADADQLLAILAMAIWPALALLWHSRRPASAIALGAGMAAAADPAYLAFAALSAGAGAALLALILRRGSATVAGAALGALIVLFPILLALPLDPDLKARLIGEFGPSAAERLQAWQSVADRIFERPFVGHGLDSLNQLQRVQNEGGLARSAYPPSGALQIWFELGLLGAVLFAALFPVLGRAIDRCELERIVRAVLIAALFAAFVATTLSVGIWQSSVLGAIGLSGALASAIAPQAGD